MHTTLNKCRKARTLHALDRVSVAQFVRGLATIATIATIATRHKSFHSKSVVAAGVIFIRLFELRWKNEAS